MDSILEPLLPVELEREIFEWAALLHARSIPTFLRVARRVQIWLEPLLYRVICVDMPRIGYHGSFTPGIPSLLNAIKSKPAALFGAVRHLFLCNVSLEDGIAVLQACPGLVDLVVLYCVSDPAILPILAGMRIQQLSVLLEEIGHLSPDFTHPAFAHITHLNVMDELIDAMAQVCEEIPTLPALTHMAIDYQVPWGIWPETERTSYEAAQIPYEHDVRFVVGICNWATYSEDWEACARSHSNFWSLADEFVAAKRAGAIEATRYWL
ncbi:hypothetical protein C8R47DRAFT_1223322 [Mycena vitilis]|nr:hypothetical protein C8R47DRAFT_1223322 [Mycena vitilis]